MLSRFCVQYFIRRKSVFILREFFRYVRNCPYAQNGNDNRVDNKLGEHISAVIQNRINPNRLTLGRI